MKSQTQYSYYSIRLGLALFAVCCSFLTSCSSPDDPLLDVLDTQLANVKIDNLNRTMNFVSSPVRFQKTQFEERLAASLNRWGKSESELMSPDSWKLDEMVQSVLDKYKDLPVASETDGLGFPITDSYNLQQNYWAKAIADRKSADKEMGPFEIYRVASEIGEADSFEDEDKDPLAFALQKLHDGLSAEDSENLSKTLKLFDFVTRNIHLLAEDALTSDIEDLDEIRLNDSEDPVAAGIPGLGYTRFPWHTMLFSRGDYVERAKVFMVLLNQLGLDSVMLEAKIDEAFKPWAVGVNVGGKLYLFDTKLGLPIPADLSGQIATLTQLRENPDLLNSLDLSVNESLKDQTKYWVKADQLKDLHALVYLPPEAASYRYFELESRLLGDARMNLVVAPSKIIEKMPKLEGVNYGIWEIEFKTHQFRRALRDAIAEASFSNNIQNKIRWYFLDELYVNEFVRYRTARSKYFQGIYETIRNDGNLNAIELFYSMIYKDSKIESLGSDKNFQRQLMITKGTMQSADQFEKTISGVQGNMRLVRRDSGFFLAQCHFDLGNFSTATNWLTRLEQIENTARWQAAINYMRGRALEAQRDYDSAIDVYNNQESEQFHGDLIRVRMLKEITGATGDVKVSVGESVDEQTADSNDQTAAPDDEAADSDDEAADSDDQAAAPDDQAGIN